VTSTAAGAEAATTSDPTLDRIAALPCWGGPVTVTPLDGGITNRNFRVAAHDGEAFVARLGADIPVHGVMRFNELGAARAAHAAGISPEVVHAEPGVMVSRFVEGRTLLPADVRRPDTLARVAALLATCHTDVARHLAGPVLAFWPFQICRGYLITLAGDGHRFAAERERFGAFVDRLERAVGPIRPALCHNDLLAANLIDDGERLWLIDWDYAGLDAPLFDLANLSSNNALSADEDAFLLAAYAARRATADGDAAPLSRGRPFLAMKAISLMRETLWSAVSERRSTIDFDYPAYTRDNEIRLEAALAAFEAAEGGAE